VTRIVCSHKLLVCACGSVMVAGKEISEEEGDKPLIPSSTSVAGRLEQLQLNTQAQTVCSGLNFHESLTSA